MNVHLAGKVTKRENASYKYLFTDMCIMHNRKWKKDESTKNIGISTILRTKFMGVEKEVITKQKPANEHQTVQQPHESSLFFVDFNKASIKK